MEIQIHKSPAGSRWFYGNFDLGILVDNHPRFTSVIVCLLFWRLAFISFRK